MKVNIVKEVKRSDALWRFACGDVLYYYPYPTRNFLLPDREEGSEKHSLYSIFDISKESKCNTFVMMDIFIIPRNDHFTLQICQSPFIFKSVIKFIKKIPSRIQWTLIVIRLEYFICHSFKIQNFIMKKKLYLQITPQIFSW